MESSQRSGRHLPSLVGKEQCPKVTWSLHKLMRIYMGYLIIGAILQYMVSAAFAGFFSGGKELTLYQPMTH